MQRKPVLMPVEIDGEPAICAITFVRPSSQNINVEVDYSQILPWQYRWGGAKRRVYSFIDQHHPFRVIRNGYRRIKNTMTTRQRQRLIKNAKTRLAMSTKISYAV